MFGHTITIVHIVLRLPSYKFGEQKHSTVYHPSPGVSYRVCMRCEQERIVNLVPGSFFVLALHFVSIPVLRRPVNMTCVYLLTEFLAS